MSLIGTLTTGVSALQSFSRGLEVIGNNIANVNTNGFKSSQTSFEDSFSNTLRGSAPSANNTNNLATTQIGTGVRISSIAARFTQGVLSTTGSPTDVGISGSGFFMVQNPADSVVYATRDGAFRLDDMGYLVNPQGLRVQGLQGGVGANAQTGAIAAPVTNASTVGSIRIGQNLPKDATGADIQLKSYSIDRQGDIIEFYADGSSNTTNRILMQNFMAPTALQKEGNNLFTGFASAGPLNGSITMTGAGNTPGNDGLGILEAGTLELSNVDLTDEFANMITTQRSFQASSRLVTVADSVLEEIVNLKR